MRVQVELSIVPHPDDGSPGVLLQLPDGYIIMRPSGAKALAALLIETASDADASQN